MSSPDPSQLTVLVNHASSLADLQRKIKQRKGSWINGATTTADNVDHQKIVDDVKKILEEFKKAEHGSLEEKAKSKVLRRMEGIFQELIRDDPTNQNHYGMLLKEIDARIKDLLKPPKPSSSAPVARLVDDSFRYPVYQSKEEDEFYFEAATKNLKSPERECFSFCSSFFSTFSTPMEINKRELIHWWIGMGLIDETLQGEEVLEKLLVEELLVNPINDDGTAANNRYTMLRFKHKLLEDVDGYQPTNLNRLFVAYEAKTGTGSAPRQAADEIVAAINTRGYTLNAKIFDLLFRMKKAKLVHLGSWHHKMDYIVVEDMIVKALSQLKNLEGLRFLSLQGISRLQDLPISVYSLRKLKVLDLRACQDLIRLPKGIENLKQLTHLDLSQCYELHFIPKGITKLSELRVLKGFIVDSTVLQFRPKAIFNRYRYSSCPFTDLSKLQKLTKLTIHIRAINFPTATDVEALCEMGVLKKLKITWVHGSTTTSDLEAPSKGRYNIRSFPTALQKLELEAAPEATVSRLLGLIANRNYNMLEKLYIRGGGLWKLDTQRHCFPNIMVVRFRYLPQLHMNWYEFKSLFPKLTRLEMHKCPHLIFFPCNENGVWEESLPSL